MDIEYFFYVDDSTLQHLRPATSDERKWYHSLAQELGPYQKNIDRFQRVEDRFSALAEILEAPEKNAAKLERNAKAPEQENKAIDALKFKEELCGPHGVLLLGKLLDPNGNELEATDSTIIKLAQEQSEASLSYQDEIPWGVCRLLQLFQGTNYQDI